MIPSWQPKQPLWPGQWEPTDLTCPECGGGTVWEDSNGNRRCDGCGHEVPEGDWPEDNPPGEEQ